MPESSELYAEIVALRNQVDDVSAATEALLRASGETMKNSILEYLRANEASRRIFLLCDGERTQAEILEILRNDDVAGGSAAGVSRRIDALVHDHNLLVRDRRRGNSPVYRHSHVAKALKIARALGA